jgi:hypothetical protein
LFLELSARACLFRRCVFRIDRWKLWNRFLWIRIRYWNIRKKYRSNSNWIHTLSLIFDHYDIISLNFGNFEKIALILQKKFVLILVGAHHSSSLDCCRLCISKNSIWSWNTFQNIETWSISWIVKIAGRQEYCDEWRWWWWLIVNWGYIIKFARLEWEQMVPGVVGCWRLKFVRR